MNICGKKHVVSKQIGRVDLIRAETNDGRSKYRIFRYLTFMYIFHFKYHIFNFQKPVEVAGNMWLKMHKYREKIKANYAGKEWSGNDISERFSWLQ